MLTSQQHLAGGMRPAHADDSDLADSGERADHKRGRRRDGIPTASRWDVAAECLLGALLLFMPFTIGAFHPWSECVVAVLVAALVACLASRLALRRDIPFVWSWSYVPVVLFVALVCLQLAWLPARWVGRLSPHTAALKNELLSDPPGAASATALPDRMTLSFYPWGTRHDLRLVLYAAAVFFVVVNVYRRPAQVRRLLATVAVIGGVAAVLSIFLVATRGAMSAGARNWTVTLRPDTSIQLGLFENYNHFSQFMNLSVGAAVGLLLVLLQEAAAAGDWDEAERIAPWRLAGRLGRSGSWAAWALVLVIVAGLVSVVLSQARGGTLAAAVALAVTLGLLSLTGTGGRGWLLALVGLAAFGIMLYFGFDAVYDRFAVAGRDSLGGRLPIWKDLVPLLRRFPLLGTGLGTHEVVFPMFDTAVRMTLPVYAENDYAQLLEETGLAGVLLAAAFVAAVGWALARCVRKAGDPRFAVRAAAYGLGFGLVAVMVQSAGDFGQHLPANACLSAVFCGLLVGLGRGRGVAQNVVGWSSGGVVGSTTEDKPLPPSALHHSTTPPLHHWLPRWAGFAATLGVAAAVVAGAVGAGGVYAGRVGPWRLPVPEVYASARGAFCWQRAVNLAKALDRIGWQGSSQDYADLIDDASRASAWCPQNVNYRYYLNAYRWRGVQQFDEPSSDTYPQYVSQIVDELHDARRLCPTFGPTYCLAGQLEFFVLDRPEGADHVRLGYRLAPNDASACLAAGRLENQLGRPDAALQPFRGAVQRNPGLLPEVMQAYLYQMRRPDLAVAMAENDARALLGLADQLERGEENVLDPDPQLANAVRQKAVGLLQAECQKPDAPLDTLVFTAALCEGQGDYAAAIPLYRRALAGAHDQISWRLRLARALQATGRTDLAIAEVRTCLQLQPGLPEALDLLVRWQQQAQQPVMPVMPGPAGGR